MGWAASLSTESAALELKLRKSQKIHIILGPCNVFWCPAREGALGNTIQSENNTTIILALFGSSWIKSIPSWCRWWRWRPRHGSMIFTADISLPVSRILFYSNWLMVIFLAPQILGKIVIVRKLCSAQATCRLPFLFIAPRWQWNRNSFALFVAAVGK